jgi:hypothetical protein
MRGAAQGDDDGPRTAATESHRAMLDVSPSWMHGGAAGGGIAGGGIAGGGIAGGGRTTAGGGRTTACGGRTTACGGWRADTGWQLDTACGGSQADTGRRPDNRVRRVASRHRVWRAADSCGTGCGCRSGTGCG